MKHAERLTANKLKITPRRNEIIEIFEKQKKYLSSEEVWNFLKKKFKKCGLPGVYRNLESLVECGILFKIICFNDDKKQYGLCSVGNEKHHHHLICIKCKKISAFENCSLNDKKKVNGYLIVNHYSQLNGICPECQKNF
ncbi:MAG TPA: Fur family transcriptional regulator [bacterium]|nr:Fur family transcriptional regulator [bacterium]HPN29654.1 Fur family transcriptional regulator [bacterium]